MKLIITLPINLEKRVLIYQGSNGNSFYCIKDNNDDEKQKLFPIYYDINFPLNWILDDYNEFSTGPIVCKFCNEYGFGNGVFIGYCSNCAAKFNYKRGIGFEIGTNVKPCKENISNIDLLEQKEKSIWETYLKDVNWENIGDLNLAENRELYKDLPELIACSDSESENEFENFDYNNLKDDCDIFIKKKKD